MLRREKEEKLNRVLEELTKELDLTEPQIREAKERYRAVGEWLEKDNSSIRSYNPDIYPQGSFRLGTMIKPIQKDDEYDLDIVCNLEDPPRKISQESLKIMVGDRLKENGDYKRMLEPEGRYCWTLKYAEGTRFQMDIVPSIPDSLRKQLYEQVLKENLYRHAIRITDRENKHYHSTDSSTWPKGNPIGYAEWFKNQMDISFKKQRQLIAENRKVSVEDIEDFEVKTPLQRSVQILKRHRDIMFGDDDEKPISIIITTLAAKAYSNESNLLEALMNIIKGIPDYIEERWDDSHGRKIKWIPNPVNPKEENFADKWAETPALEEKFYDWYKKVKKDLVYLNDKGLTESFEVFGDSFGENIIANSFKKADIPIPQKKTDNIKLGDIKSLFNVSHRESPPWPLKIKEKVNIFARFKQKEDSGWKKYSPEDTIPKSCDIIFSAKTNISKPFKVYWQVVNTGKEAKEKNGLRGSIFPSTTAGVGGLKQKESTLYKGVHWIECFIVKNGICKARSGEFLVRIQ